MTHKDYRYYKCMIDEFHTGYEFYDIHAHPLDIFYNFEYAVRHEDYCALGDKPFSSRLIEASEAKYRPNMPHSSTFNPLMKRFYCSSTYYYTGCKYFKLLSQLANIDKCVLLHPANSTDEYLKDFSFIFKYFSNGPQFLFGGSVPNDIPDADIDPFLRSLLNKFNIVCVKIHPNLSRLDLTDPLYRNRLSLISNICCKLDMPLIIHGGHSNFLPCPERKYAQIENLFKTKFDKSIPIIIAHGAIFDVPMDHVVKHVIPKLKTLMKTNENILIDVSGLSYRQIFQLLKCIPTDKILFGSDALYENPLHIQIRLLKALKRLNIHAGKTFLKIINLNPKKIFKFT